MYKAVRKCKAHAEPGGGDVTPVRKARLAYQKCGVVVITVEIEVISGYDGDSGLIRKKIVSKREISFMKEGIKLADFVVAATFLSSLQSHGN